MARKTADIRGIDPRRHFTEEASRLSISGVDDGWGKILQLIDDDLCT
ncbi:hypothetical protein [Neorhizobium galegae]|nr:hypothetical protein [Neorhizobium galegae]MCQ1809110.1 hypothetical protein [Neorhizobium galegae]